MSHGMVTVVITLICCSFLLQEPLSYLVSEDEPTRGRGDNLQPMCGMLAFATVINYTADLIIVTWLFDGYDEVIDLLYCVASCLFGIAITSLYLNRPLLMLPDVIYKITVSFCSLFFAIEEVDSGSKGSMTRLVLILCAVLLQFFENYVLFMALSAQQLEQQRLVQHRPPPAYEQLSALNLMQRTGEPCCSKPVVPDELKKARPETPPPCYESAMETLKTSKKDVHIV